MIAPRPGRTTDRLAVRRSTVVAGWTLISRATGLVRVLVIGAVLGPTYFANVFITANTVPSLTYSLIVGQVLAAVVVPPLVRALTEGGAGRAGALLGRISGLLLIASGAVAVLIVLAAPVLARSLTFAIPDVAVRIRAQHLTTVLILLVAPQVVLYTLAGLGAAAQQARERFALSSAAPALENVLLIAALLVVVPVWGTGLDIGDVPAVLPVVLGAGSTLAVGAHAAVQAAGARRAGLPIRPSWRWRSDPEAVEVFSRLRGSVSVPAAPVLSMFALLVVAGTVPGGVVVVQAAYSVFQFPIALGARAIATAVLPRMSAAAARDDSEGFVSAWHQALTFATITSLPMLLLLGVFARPIAHVLANGELRSPLLIDQLAVCLAVVALAQVPASVHTVGRGALFARLDIRGPRQASLALLGATLVLAAVSLSVPADTARLALLCVALLAGELIGAVWVLVRLRRALRAGSRTRIGRSR